jgi:hypothetical protein
MLLLGSTLLLVCAGALWWFLRTGESLDQAHQRAMAKFDQVLAEQRNYNRTWESEWAKVPRVRAKSERR